MSGSKIWYCVNCGYETDRRGRCHRCRTRLDASPLPELEAGDDEEEVGYRVEEWEDADRGRLIVALIRANVEHRFEDDELVVDAENEERVDDLLADLRVVLAAERAEAADAEGEPTAAHDAEEDEDDEGDEDLEAEEDEYLAADDPTWESVRALHGAAMRLREDPTDMAADADVAEYSAGVFAADDFVSIDPDTWAAVGRVTRRLLAALGADEALEDEIRTQAGVLVKLLQPTVDPAAAEENRLVRGEAQGTDELLAESTAALPEGRRDHGDADEAPEPEAPVAVEVEGEVEATEADVEDEEPEADDTVEAVDEGEEAPRRADRREAKRLRRQARSRLRRRRRSKEPDDEEPEEEAPAEAEDEADEEEVDAGEDEEEVEEEVEEESAGDEVREVASTAAAAEVVYELPEWLPEQRANLSVMLDAEGIPHEWDGGDLVVSGTREEEVDAIFRRIEGDEGAEEDEEARYRTLEELFAAADRLAKDPASKDRRDDARLAIEAADGPTPVGLDDSQWWPIRSRAHNLLEALTVDAGVTRVADEAAAVRNLLRAVV